MFPIHTTPSKTQSLRCSSQHFTEQLSLLKTHLFNNTLLQKTWVKVKKVISKYKILKEALLIDYHRAHIFELVFCRQQKFWILCKNNYFIHAVIHILNLFAYLTYPHPFSTFSRPFYSSGG